MISGIDVSNYSGLLTTPTIDCLQQNSIGHVVVRASLESPAMITTAKAQLASLRAKGISTSAYAWTYSDWEPRRTVQDTDSTYGDLVAVRTMWLDVEPYSLTNPRLPSLDWLAEAVDEARRLGWMPGIYTGKWVWAEPRYPYQNSSRFSADGVPLWTAEFDGVPDLSKWSRYGGWASPAMKQYAGSGQQALCGLSCDLNVLDPALAYPPVPAPPPVVTGLPLDEAYVWIGSDLKHAEEAWKVAQYSHSVRKDHLDALARS